MSPRRFIDKTVDRKIFQSDEWGGLARKLDDYRREGKAIGLATGCFDLLHIGHVRMLREAADRCDILVVGLNTDLSVRRLKGSERPIVRQWDRGEMVASLEGVSFVTWFEADDPRALIAQVKPHLYVKGGDYANQELPESAVVTENGGRVICLDYHRGHSTTGLLGHIRETSE